MVGHPCARDSPVIAVARTQWQLSPRVDVALTPIKQELLKDVHGDVLEIGCAYGVNLKYYTKPVRRPLHCCPICSLDTGHPR